MTYAVQCKDIDFSYGQTSILRKLNLDIKEGSFAGIVGPNGGGKTTLLRLLMGFLSPSAGTLSLFNQSPEKAKKDIAYVPQSMQYDQQFPISVLEVVLAGRLSHLAWHGHFTRKDRLLAMEALERVGISSLAKQAFGTLSGGQAQRVLIARALISNPRLLLLDEPTASVDSKTEEEIYQLLKDLKGSMTILMVTHDLRAATSFVDQVICVQGEAFVLDPAKVCEHFAIGLYHTPLQAATELLGDKK
jgi:zinc transport system ATP-binding protein